MYFFPLHCSFKERNGSVCSWPHSGKREADCTKVPAAWRRQRLCNWNGGKQDYARKSRCFAEQRSIRGRSIDQCSVIAWRSMYMYFVGRKVFVKLVASLGNRASGAHAPWRINDSFPFAPPKMGFDVARTSLYFLVPLASVLIYFAVFFVAVEPYDTLLPPATTDVAPYRHSCQYCQLVNIQLSSEPSADDFDLLVSLKITSSLVAHSAVRNCPLLRDAHDASTTPFINRIWCHSRTFFDIFSTNSDLHSFTGCRTFFQRACCFLRGLSSQPFHIRLSHLPPESGGTLYARVLWTAARLFEFDVSAGPGITCRKLGHIAELTSRRQSRRSIHYREASQQQCRIPAHFGLN